MNSDANSLRSSLGKVRGLGSAKSGTEHWLLQRMTAVALLALVLYLFMSFLREAVAGGYTGAMYWLQSPVTATLTVLFLLTGLRHGAAGLQVVIEDYIHKEIHKIGLLFVVNFSAAALAILGTLSTAKIFFGV